jgi:hypothetical protein
MAQAENADALYIDVQKSVVDYAKHVTTLSAGSIVVLVSLIDKLFSDAKAIELVMASLASFIAATILLTLAIVGVLRSMRTPSAVSAGVRSYTGITLGGGLAAFAVGTLLLAIFGITNLANS